MEKILDVQDVLNIKDVNGLQDVLGVENIENALSARDLQVVQNMRDIIFVLDPDGKPLMPSRRFRHIRELIKAGKAKKLSSNPYVVQLLYDTPGKTQPLILGIDPGRTNIAVTVVLADGTPIWSAQLSTRNKEIPKLKKQQKMYRQDRRHNRRKKRQRRAIRCGTTTKKPCKEQKQITATTSVGVIERFLPGCKEPIYCIGIKNKEARFNNRRRKAGWLTPTANQLKQTHVNLVKKVMQYLPITTIALEVNRFAFMALDNPDIKKWQYQKGPLSGQGSVNEAVDTMQNGHCLFCEKPIEAHHHIVPQSKGGSDTIGNICGLCAKHHTKVHTDAEWHEKMTRKKAGMNKKYGALSVLNQIIPSLTVELSKLAPTLVTTGMSTKAFREAHGIEKDHHTDAYCIACSTLSNPTNIVKDLDYVQIRQFRRHDRKACKRHMLDRKYILKTKEVVDGKEDVKEVAVAVNRHKATRNIPGSEKTVSQEEDSLEEYLKRPDAAKVGCLRVQEHKPIYQELDRILPGAKFVVDGKIKVMVASQGRQYTKQGSKPSYYRFSDGTKATPKQCKLLCQNTGLVFM